MIHISTEKNPKKKFFETSLRHYLVTDRGDTFDPIGTVLQKLDTEVGLPQSTKKGLHCKKLDNDYHSSKLVTI